MLKLSQDQTKPAAARTLPPVLIEDQMQQLTYLQYYSERMYKYKTTQKKLLNT